MEKDSQREYREEMQEVMWELKLKTNKFIKKLEKVKDKDGEKESKKDYHEEMQEVMWELKLGGNELMKKFDEENRKNKFRHGTVK